MIVETDIVWYLSSVSSNYGNSKLSQPTDSLGTYISQSPVNTSTLFDALTGEENVADYSIYRCIFILNNHDSLPLYDVRTWLTVESSATITVGVDPIEASLRNSELIQAGKITAEDKIPSNVDFITPTSRDTGVEIGDLLAGYCRAIWICRTSNNSVLAQDTFSLRVEGFSAV